MKFIDSFLIPLLLIIFLVFSTAFLISQTENLISHDEIFSGLIVGEEPIFVDTVSWQKYYNGGLGIDRVISYDSESIRISTGSDGDWYGAYTNIKKVDFNNHDLRVTVRVDNWGNLDRFAILLSTGEGFFENYFILNLRNHFSKPENEEWIELVLNKSDFIIAEGTPQWSEVNRIGIRVIPTKDNIVRVWLDGFAIFPKKDFDATVTLSFDDGFQSVSWAANKMDTYGFRGILYVIPDFLGNNGYLKQEDVDLLSKKGWDIGGHHQNNFRELSVLELDTVLAEIYKYLEEKNYKGWKNFAYPNGSYNKSVQSQVLEYFDTARSIDGFLQSKSYLISSNIQAKTVSKETSVGEIKEWIDGAVSDGAWLNIVWHDFVDEPDSDIEYKKRDFEEVLTYLNKKDVEVKTFSDAYNQILEY